MDLLSEQKTYKIPCDSPEEVVFSNIEAVNFIIQMQREGYSHSASKQYDTVWYWLITFTKNY